MKKLVLIDGFSIINRAFYGVPPLTNSAGLHTNAVFGFFNIMFRMLDDENADYLAVAFDLPAPTFRHEKYPEYKGKRKSMPDELLEQVPLVKEVLAAMNVPILSKEGFEADDIIGTIAKRYQSEEIEVSVLSGDRDLLQLADEHIKIRIPKTTKGQTLIKDYYPADVLSEYLVTPTEFIDLKALMGDASDNIPGVPSIGEKTATAIITRYKSIEEAYKHVEEITPKRAKENLQNHYDLAEFSKWLATIKIDVDIETNLEDFHVHNLYTSKAYDLIRNLEFKSFFKRFEGVESENTANAEFKDMQFKAEMDAVHAFSNAKNAKELGLGYLISNVQTPFGENLPVIRHIALAYEDTILVLSKMEGWEEELRELFASGTQIVTIDLKPLLKLLSNEGNAFSFRHFHDLKIAAYILNPLKDSYDVGDIARDYLQISLKSLDEIRGKKKLEDVIDAAEEQLLYYLGASAKVALKANPVMREQLLDMGSLKLYTDIEMPLLFSLAKMEMTGIGVDAIRLKVYSQKLEEQIAVLTGEIHAEVGEQFNINSPKQLGEILFEKMGIPGGKKTKSGYSTAADILDKLAEDYPFVKKILEYRQLTKLNSTYALGLAEYIKEDGRIHGIFNQTVAATGRISSTEPNLQNIPIRTELGSQIRDIFVPREGYVFVDADYSQIELRILASMSGDAKLIESYQSSIDIHATTAANVFGVPLDAVTPELRRNAKAVNFGVVYGISAFGLSEDLSISKKEAKEYINNYFATYPDVKKFLDANVNQAKEQGFVTTLFGRVRPIPEIKSSNFMQRSFGDRVAMNSPIQGTAADIIKIAMIKVDEALVEYGDAARIVLQVHDELLLEVREDLADEIKAKVEDCMRNAADLHVPLEVEANIGRTWLDAK